jgi:hypothetical protein
MRPLPLHRLPNATGAASEDSTAVHATKLLLSRKKCTGTRRHLHTCAQYYAPFVRVGRDSPRRSSFTCRNSTQRNCGRTFDVVFAGVEGYILWWVWVFMSRGIMRACRWRNGTMPLEGFDTKIPILLLLPFFS